MALLCFAGKRRLLMAAGWFALAVAADATPVTVDLSAQPAASALVAFAQQAGVEVLFSYRDLSAVRSPAVAGRFEPAEALARLLANTGFVASRNASGKFVIVRAETRRSSLRGQILDDLDGAAIAGALVRLDNDAFALRTDENGRFRFDDVTSGEHALLIRADGYRSVRIAHATVAPDQRVDLGAVRLVRGADDPEQLGELVVNANQLGEAADIVSLQAVTVTPSRYALAEERGTVAATLTETDLQALPQLGEDLYRAISHLPGLAADDFTAKFWVRGAPYDKVLARLDGVDLIEPFHLKDLDSTVSILDLETISRMDLYTGGFTADYGNRLAGVLTLETDRHVRDQPRNTLGVSLTGVRAATRGATRDRRNHWLLSGRTGYPALALDLADNGNVVKPHYDDVYAKWEYDVTPQHTVSVHALHADDTMEFRDASGPIMRSRYGSDYMWTRWQGSFGENAAAETVLSGTWLNWHRTGSGLRNNLYPLALNDDRRLRTLALRQDWTLTLAAPAILRAGVEATSTAARYSYHATHDEPTVRDGELVTNTLRRDARAAPDGSSGGAYTTVRVRPWKPLTLEAGLRFDGDNYADDRDVTPRLNGAYTRGHTTLRAAWGEYAQSQGLHELAFGDGETVFHRAERAEHRILSLEHRFGSGVNLRAEAYERIVRHPRPHWENVVDALDVVGELSYDRREIDPVRQRARGVELIAEQRSNRRFAWSATCAPARSDETLRDGTLAPRARDQRHTLYLDASYTPNPRWQISAAWQYHTGWPATPVEFTVTPLTNGGAAVFGHPGALYSTRLPDYHRLDFRIQRRMPFRDGQLRLYLDVFNAYARRNSIGYRYTVTVHGPEIVAINRENDHSLFPLLPSLGAVWDF